MLVAVYCESFNLIFYLLDALQLEEIHSDRCTPKLQTYASLYCDIQIPDETNFAKQLRPNFRSHRKGSIICFSDQLQNFLKAGL